MNLGIDDFVEVWIRGQERKKKNTVLFNRITNSDTRIHLPVFYDEECRNYLMSRRESLVGWKWNKAREAGCFKFNLKMSN